jgi:hypothetical protein
MNMDDYGIDGEDGSRALALETLELAAGDAEDYALNDIGLAIRIWSEVA